MNDQTAKADAGKPKLTLVPTQIIKDICEVREYGNAKYPEGGPDNWKNVDKQRYRDALFRHFLAYLEDPHGVDEESGIEHYKHMACNMAFLCEMESWYHGEGVLVTQDEDGLHCEDLSEVVKFPDKMDKKYYILPTAENTK